MSSAIINQPSYKPPPPRFSQAFAGSQPKQQSQPLFRYITVTTSQTRPPDTSHRARDFRARLLTRNVKYNESTATDRVCPRSAYIPPPNIQTICTATERGRFSRARALTFFLLILSLVPAATQSSPAVPNWSRVDTEAYSLN